MAQKGLQLRKTPVQGRVVDRPIEHEIASRALIWTLGQAIDDFNDETQDAWQAALTAITETMKSSAAGA